VYELCGVTHEESRTCSAGPADLLPVADPPFWEPATRGCAEAPDPGLYKKGSRAFRPGLEAR
jgi:hypothetical protein